MGATDRAFEAFEAMGPDQMGAPLWAGVLPFPPSTNHYWGASGRRRFLTPKALEFRAAVAAVSVPSSPIACLVRVRVDLWAPDKRTRDLDNFAGKALYDALRHAGVLADDSSEVVRQTLHSWRGVDKLRPRCCVEVWGMGQ